MKEKQNKGKVPVRENKKQYVIDQSYRKGFLLELGTGYLNKNF